MSLRTAAAALCFALALAPSANAQHPMPPGPRPLHARIADADVVAIATVGQITEGRIQIRDAAVLRGDAPADFAIKRSPLRPPPLETGVPAVLLLRGARSPYVLVDDPREVILLPGAVAAERWKLALQALFEAGTDPVHLLHVYLVWLDGDDEGLREAAAAALSDPRAPFRPLGPEDAVARARVAADPRRAAPARRVSAGLAVTNPDGAAALIAGLPGPVADPQVIATALRAATSVPAPQREAALLRALGHDEPDVRRAALSAAGPLWSDAVAAKIAELAARDPDPGVRAAAKDEKAQAPR